MAYSDLYFVLLQFLSDIFVLTLTVAHCASDPRGGVIPLQVEEL